MILKQGYALKLETAFRIGNEIPVSADRFQLDYHSAFEEGLSSLCARGIISTDEFKLWLEEYGIDNMTLGEIIDDALRREMLQELYERIRAITQKWREDK